MTIVSFLLLESSGFCFRSFDTSGPYLLCFPLGPRTHQKPQHPPSFLDGKCELGVEKEQNRFGC